MSEPRYTRLVAPLPSTVPFVGPEAQERARGRRFRARIGANESVFGPSPKAIAAMQAAAAEAWMYCDPDNFDLKASLAASLGIKAENIAVGERRLVRGWRFWVWMKSGNFMGSRTKKTGVLLPTRSQLPSCV